MSAGVSEQTKFCPNTFFLLSQIFFVPDFCPIFCPDHICVQMFVKCFAPTIFVSQIVVPNPLFVVSDFCPARICVPDLLTFLPRPYFCQDRKSCIATGADNKFVFIIILICVVPRFCPGPFVSAFRPVTIK